MSTAREAVSLIAYHYGRLGKTIIRTALHI